MLVTGNKTCYDAHKNIARMKNFSSWHFGRFLPSAYCIRNFRRGLTCFAKYIIEGEKEMSTSMTKGSPLKLMLSFAFPLLVGNLLQQTYNIIDAAIVGQILGAKALASVGASSSIQFLVLGFCMGSCTGFGVPVAKYFGAGKIRQMKNYVFNGALLTAGIAAILTTVCSILCPQI